MIFGCYHPDYDVIDGAIVTMMLQRYYVPVQYIALQ